MSASVERSAAVVVVDAFDESSDTLADVRTSAQTWDFRFRPVCTETGVADEAVDGKDG